MLPVSLRICRFIHSCTSFAGISLVYGCQLSDSMKLTGGYGLRSSSFAMGYSVISFTGSDFTLWLMPYFTMKSPTFW
ncbi:hypothetical protein [Citrobacter sp. RHBSTW-00678]|uniref:hypothetical protein n=1 Tax=Citrobacter sp. RHBSTW-00678 TaxID=2742661 RepID=UPI002E0F5AF9